MVRPLVISSLSKQTTQLTHGPFNAADPHPAQTLTPLAYKTPHSIDRGALLRFSFLPETQSPKHDPPQIRSESHVSWFGPFLSPFVQNAIIVSSSSQKAALFPNLHRKKPSPTASTASKPNVSLLFSLTDITPVGRSLRHHTCRSKPQLPLVPRSLRGKRRTRGSISAQPVGGESGDIGGIQKAQRTIRSSSLLGWTSAQGAAGSCAGEQASRREARNSVIPSLS